jgi:hypothetical protein
MLKYKSHSEYLGYLLVRYEEYDFPISYEPDEEDASDGAVINSILQENYVY